MRNRNWKTAIITTLLVIATAQAGIPEPDAIFYGTVTINGTPVGGSDSTVQVIAKRAGTPNIVGSYTMGDDAGAATANNYVLRVRLENIAADGSTQSDDALLVGQSVDIYVQRGTSPEVRAVQNAAVTERGMVQARNLSVQITGPIPGDIDGDGDADQTDVGLFVQVLLGSNTNPSHVQASDLNSSGQANGLDIQGFVQAIVVP